MADRTDASNQLAIGLSLREEARAVLTDLPQWTASPVRWNEIQTWLDALASAFATGDANGLMTAVTELEVLSPLRATRLGTDPVGPAPRRTQLVHNKLVHDLGLVDADPGLATAFDADPPQRPPTTSTVSQQELAIHYFAPTDGELCDAAYAQLTGIWTYCHDALEATRAIPRLGLPTILAPALPGLPKVPAVAAITNAYDTVQAILRWEHDILVLSVLVAAEADRAGEGWPGLDRVWNPTVDNDALLGSARLHLGSGPAPDGPPVATVAATLAQASDQIAQVGDCVVLTMATADELASERSLIVLAGSGDEAALSAWAWSRGDAGIPPFARYLVNAAKLRYEARIRRSAGEAIWVRPNESSAELSTIITRLSDMRMTVDVARENMAAALGAASPVGFVADDARLAHVLDKQLTADITYLSNERERRSLSSMSTVSVRSAQQTTPTFGLVTAMPEEFAAMLLFLADARSVPVAGDRADYLVGSMDSSDPNTPHQVALTMLGETATASAAETVSRLLHSHQSIDQVVMVGIAAGVPAPDDPVRHVRLGDVIAATWGIVPYDHIIDRPAGPVLRQGFPRPSALLARRAKMLEAEAILGHYAWEALFDRIVESPTFARPDDATDILHAGDTDRVLPHPRRADSGHRLGRPKVHYGALASADRSVRNAAFRDDLAARFAVRGMEMEGSGVGTAAFASGREWFVVRGVSDYADTHFAQTWRRYASATAAAYVAALLSRCPPIATHGGQTHGRPTVVRGPRST